MLKIFENILPMKTKLLKYLLPAFMTVLISVPLFAQRDISSGDSSRSHIIATTSLDSFSTTIVSYDYINYCWDTLFTSNDRNIGRFWFSTYDSYHRKYFYYGINVINDSTSTMSFYSLDLYTQQIDSLFTIDNTPAVDMLYDIFRNSLLVRVSDAILNYNLTNKSLDSLMTIPHATELYVVYAHFYDFMQQKYTYRRSSPNMGWVTIDLKEALVDTVFPDTLINNLYAPVAISFDYKSGLFYGTTNEKITKNGYIVSTGSHPNYASIIAAVPANFLGFLNQQKACFDAERGYYLLPYLTDSNNNMLAIIDVQNNTVNTTSFSRPTNHHHLDNLPNPIIKLEDSVLLTNWYSNYSWYLNGNALPQSNSQTWKPKTTGWYKVSTVRPDSSIAFSENVYVAFANISRANKEDVSIKISPNPARNFFTLEIESNNLPIHNIDIALWDMSGKLINDIHFENYTGPIIFSTERKHSGVYVVTITYNNITYRKKLVISG